MSRMHQIAALDANMSVALNQLKDAIYELDLLRDDLVDTIERETPEPGPWDETDKRMRFFTALNGEVDVITWVTGREVWHTDGLTVGSLAAWRRHVGAQVAESLRFDYEGEVAA